MVPLRRLVALIVIARVRFNVQLVMAVLLCVAGLALVFCGFWVAPSGEIDNSVLDRIWGDLHVCRRAVWGGLLL